MATVFWNPSTPRMRAFQTSAMPPTAMRSSSVYWPKRSPGWSLPSSAKTGMRCVAAVSRTTEAPWGPAPERAARRHPGAVLAARRHGRWRRRRGAGRARRTGAARALGARLPPAGPAAPERRRGARAPSPGRCRRAGWDGPAPRAPRNRNPPPPGPCAPPSPPGLPEERRAPREERQRPAPPGGRRWGAGRSSSSPAPGWRASCSAGRRRCRRGVGAPRGGAGAAGAASGRGAAGRGLGSGPQHAGEGLLQAALDVLAAGGGRRRPRGGAAADGREAAAGRPAAARSPGAAARPPPPRPGRRRRCRAR